MAEVVTCRSCQRRNRVPAVASGRPRCGACQTDLPWLVSATDADLQAVVLDSSLPVLVDLWAPWCAPCQTISPALERIATERAGRLKLVKINVDENPAAQARFQASSVPTLVLLRHGQVVSLRRGALPYPLLNSWVTTSLQQEA